MLCFTETLWRDWRGQDSQYTTVIILLTMCIPAILIVRLLTGARINLFTSRTLTQWHACTAVRQRCLQSAQPKGGNCLSGWARPCDLRSLSSQDTS